MITGTGDYWFQTFYQQINPSVAADSNDPSVVGSIGRFKDYRLLQQIYDYRNSMLRCMIFMGYKFKFCEWIWISWRDNKVVWFEITLYTHTCRTLLWQLDVCRKHSNLNVKQYWKHSNLNNNRYLILIWSSNICISMVGQYDVSEHCWKNTQLCNLVLTPVKVLHAIDT